MAATGERFAEYETAGIAANVAGDCAAVSYHRGRLCSGSGFSGRFNGFDADALREKRRGIALAFAADAGNTAGIGDPAKRPIGVARAIIAIVR